MQLLQQKKTEFVFNIHNIYRLVDYEIRSIRKLKRFVIDSSNLNGGQ